MTGVHEGRLAGKVAFITGAGRGQGRSHAVRFAAEGADIIAVDICVDIPSVPYPLASREDLAETARRVEALGRRVVARVADVRDVGALQEAISDGVTILGPVDIIVANAGVAPLSLHPTETDWEDVVGVNLTGVHHTVEVALPSMIEAGKGGSIILISSTAGNNGIGGNSAGGHGYTAAKHGVVGLMRAYANYLAPHSIRVNTVHPGGVRTPMVTNPAVQDFLQQGGFRPNALPVTVVESEDISNAVAWLASDEAKYVTGIILPVDAGFSVKR